MDSYSIGPWTIIGNLFMLVACHQMDALCISLGVVRVKSILSVCMKVGGMYGQSSMRIPIERVDSYRWRIPQRYNGEMRVPGMVYADR